MSVRATIAPKAESSSKFGIPSNFEKIRKEHLAKGTLYEDPTFPASDSSIFKHTRPPRYPLQWARPKDVVRDPHLFVDSSSRFDLNQGELGDCWVVAALASISEYPQMVHRIVPVGQSFDRNWYAGMFVFHFWHFGKWIDVIVDDRLPTYKGKLVFIHSHQKNEFWGALVEKAYAKLVGDYEALKGGLIGDAMADFTSGLTESMALDNKKSLPHNLYHILLKAFERQSLLGAGIKATTGGQKTLTGNILSNGLVAGHAYSVTDVKQIHLVISAGSKLVNLIRVRNPWGDAVEWKGAWSDTSTEWNMITEKDRKEVGLTKADDGEFWMDWRDFLANYTTLDICHLPPTLSVLSAKRWQCCQYYGVWTTGKTAGGRPYCRETFWKNPQFLVHLRDSEDDDNDTCTLLVALAQKDKRKEGEDYLNIGFVIYKATPKYTIPYPKEFFVYNRFIASCPFFVNARECVGRYELDEGSYVIVPCTYDPNKDSQFLLRLFFENAGSEVEEPVKAKSSEASDVGSVASNSYSSHASTNCSPGSSVSQQNGQSPNTSMTSFRNAFIEVAGSKMAVDAYQLTRLLNQIVPSFHKWPLTPEAGKSLVSLADRDETFTLTYHDVEFLMHYINAWLRTFHEIDKTQSGSLSAVTLRDVIAGMGYRVPDSLVRRFIHRFSNIDNRIPLSSLISCLAFIVKVMNIFHNSSNGKVRAHLTLEEFFRAGLII